MKLLELFITETTEEDRAIISLSSAVYNHIRKYIDYIDPENPEPIDVGKIDDFCTTPLDGMEDIHLELQSGDAFGRRVAKIKEVDYDGKNPRGLWLKEIPAIVLNADFLDNERIKSTIVHELRHALDDLKSSGKANSSNKYRTPKKKEYRKKDPYYPDIPYLAEPAEINSRFAQVLDSLVSGIADNSELPNDQLRTKMHRELKRLLKVNRIARFFPEKEKSRDYKRLIKRAVDMIDKEISYQKSL